MEYAIERTFEQDSINIFDFSYKIFKNCSFANCTLTEKDFTNSIFHNCQFVHCKIKDCTFQSAIFQDGGLWQACILESNNFSKAIIGNVKIENSTFIDNHINKTIFDGTDLTKIIFFGKITSSWFYGTPIGMSSDSIHFLPFFRKFKPLKTPIIDFENADLSDVVFSRGLNLSSVKFPDQSHLKLVHNPVQFFGSFLKNTKKIFLDSETREFCKELVNTTLFRPSDREMPIVLIDFSIFNSKLNNERIQIIVELLKKS